MSYGAIDAGAKSRAGKDGARVARAGDRHGGGGCRFVAALLPWTQPAVLATPACLALGQFGWHAIGLGYWIEFLDKFGKLLASPRGIVSMREAEAAGLEPMSWPFYLSIVERCPAAEWARRFYDRSAERRQMAALRSRQSQGAAGFTLVRYEHLPRDVGAGQQHPAVTTAMRPPDAPLRGAIDGTAC